MRLAQYLHSINSNYCCWCSCYYIQCVWVLITQWCPSLCNTMDYSSPGSSVHGILQERILEWVDIPFTRRSSWPRDQTWVSCIAGRLFTVSANNLHGVTQSAKAEPTWRARAQPLCRLGASLVAQLVKNSPAMREIPGWSLGQENPLEEGMATHSSILAWEGLWTEEPGRLQSMGSQRVGYN